MKVVEGYRQLRKLNIEREIVRRMPNFLALATEIITELELQSNLFEMKNTSGPEMFFNILKYAGDR